MKIERKCTIVSKERMGDAVYMVLEVGDMVRTTFQNPGQFIHIKCGEGLLLRRPISVCSCMEDDPSDLLAIVFEVRGEGTDWLAQRMEGEQLDVLGLAGNGFNVKRDGRYLLVGGGIGVPPLLGCARSTGGRSTAVLGFRSRGKSVLLKSFQNDCAKVLIATDDGSMGYHGFADALVRQELEQDRAYDGVLACGPKPMLRSVAKVAGGVWNSLSGLHGGTYGLRCGRIVLVALVIWPDGSRKHVCKVARYLTQGGGLECLICLLSWPVSG